MTVALDAAAPAYVFLTRRPRIWRLGNPDELGFKEEGVDRDQWYHSYVFVSDMLFTLEHAEYGLGSEWFDNTMYYYECAKIGVLYSEQGYSEFNSLLQEAMETKIPDKLFVYSPPVLSYQIPEQDTPSRQVFDNAVAVYVVWWKRREETRMKLVELVKTIKREV